MRSIRVLAAAAIAAGALVSVPASAEAAMFDPRVGFGKPRYTETKTVQPIRLANRGTAEAGYEIVEKIGKRVVRVRTIAVPGNTTYRRAVKTSTKNKRVIVNALDAKRGAKRVLTPHAGRVARVGIDSAALRVTNRTGVNMSYVVETDNPETGPQIHHLAVAAGTTGGMPLGVDPGYVTKVKVSTDRLTVFRKGIVGQPDC